MLLTGYTKDKEGNAIAGMPQRRFRGLMASISIGFSKAIAHM